MKLRLFILALILHTPFSYAGSNTVFKDRDYYGTPEQRKRELERKEVERQRAQSAEKLRKKNASIPATCDTYKALRDKLSSNNGIQLKIDTLHHGSKSADNHCQ